MLTKINPFAHKSHIEKLTGQTRRVPDTLEANKVVLWPW